MMLPTATQVADPFHVVKLAATCVDEVRRRVQNDTCGDRGRKDDPLYRIRRLLLMADERLNEAGQTKVRGLLAAGDPKAEVKGAWHAYQVVREIYTTNDADTGAAFVARLAADLQDEAGPPEVRRLGRTFTKWQSQIAAWHRSHVSNGPTELRRSFSGQESQANGYRHDQLRQLPTRITALRRPPQPGTPQPVAPPGNPKRPIEGFRHPCRGAARQRLRGLRPIPSALLPRRAR